MPERDSPIDFDDLPSIQTEKRVDESPAAEVLNVSKSRPEPARSAGSVLPLILVVILFGLVLALGYMLYQQRQFSMAAETRIAALEGRLSTTDESLSQSSVAMQVRLVELKERTDELWTQMDKLWASAWRRNQSDLADLAKKTEDAGKKLQALSSSVNQQEKLAATLKTDSEQYKTGIQQLKTDVKNIAAAQKNTDQQQKTIDDLRKQLDSLKGQQQKLQKQIEENAGWIESNNAFRQQTNQTLNRLDQQIKALQKPAP